MKSIKFLILVFSFLASMNVFGAQDPNKVLVLTNQFGEKSINFVQSNGIPLQHDVVYFSGATTPVNGGSGTGVGFAGPGSIYAARDTGVIYLNTNTKASPTWASAGTTTNAATIASTLTAFSAGAGTVSSSDSILTAFQKVAAINNGTFVPTTETVSAAGAISTTKMKSTLSNGTGSTYAATLAAPSSQDGQIKILIMGTATHTVTVAMTNISVSGAYTPTGTTTLTFTSAGDSAILMAVGSKWVYLGGSAVAS